MPHKKNALRLKHKKTYKKKSEQNEKSVVQTPESKITYMSVEQAVSQPQINSENYYENILAEIQEISTMLIDYRRRVLNILKTRRITEMLEYLKTTPSAVYNRVMPLADEELQAKLHTVMRNHLCVITTRGDGNCMFRAFSRNIFEHEENHLAIRTIACLIIAEHWNHFRSHQVLYGEYDTVQQLIHDTTLHNQNRGWGSNAHLKAVAIAASREVFLYSPITTVHENANFTTIQLQNLFNEGELNNFRFSPLSDQPHLKPIMVLLTNAGTGGAHYSAILPHRLDAPIFRPRIRADILPHDENFPQFSGTTVVSEVPSQNFASSITSIQLEKCKNRLARRAEYMRKRRTNEKEEEKSKRLKLQNERTRAHNNAENESERLRRLQVENERNRICLAIEDENKRLRRLQLVNERVQIRIATENENERLERLQVINESNRARINAEDEIAAEQRRTADAARHRRIRMRHQPTYLCAAQQNVQEHYVGQLNNTCVNCQAKHFRGERPPDKLFKNCCHKGKVRIERLSPYPELLSKLLTENNLEAKHFRDNIRIYNSAMAFASLGVNIDIPPGRGPYCFKIHGQIYHRISHINQNSTTPKYAELYFLDADEALRNRQQLPPNQTCLPAILQQLDQLMRSINPFAEAYKFLREVEQEERLRVIEEGEQEATISLQLREDRRYDQRRYNLPTSNEVAVVFKNQEGEPPLHRDIRIYLRQNATQFINMSVLSPNCDPMSYPILFPRGEPGWQTGMLHHQPRPTRNSHVTLLEFYSHRLSIRDEFNPILNAGKLTQQYIVDAYTKVEANRLHYNRTHQARLRVDRYQGLMDHLYNRAERADVQVGNMVILPSSFQGSPRAMKQHYMDAMAMIGKFGKPDLFITFTCNPKWKEITENLAPWQKAEHRPDLTVRVFQLKLKELIHDLKTKHVMGVPIAELHVIEFQKRGLPHAHILIILRQEDKFHEPDDIDKFVCAEFPDAIEEPRLHALVRSHMIHGPCGQANPNCPCMTDGKCSKRFPKDFSEITLPNVNGYPYYRRRNTGNVYEMRNATMDNRWVVPYNKWLLLKYNAHINVEICSSVKSVKYICKYFYKGYDCANVEIRAGDTYLDYDEITTYQDSRYVSAPEGMWRILEFKMHEQTHSIIRLPIHLPLQQSVYFREGEEAAAVQRAENAETMLTAWFQLNQTDVNANSLLYTEVPLQYVFNRNNTWNRRQKKHDTIITRLYSVSPKDTERFYLRLLLLHKTGARSFEDIRTVEGIVHPTFKEAARSLNLLTDDSEWNRCLEEGVATQMPKQLRQLFATILVFCDVSEPLLLWEQFKTNMMEDYVRKYDAFTSEQRTLADIQAVFILNGTRCSNFDLPEPQQHFLNVIEENINVQEELLLGFSNRELLNPAQRVAFDSIMTAVQNSELPDRYFFLEGCGGTGKTFVYNTLISTLRGQGMHVLAVAWTGIAAMLLKGGRTVHSQFKLPVPLLDTSTAQIKPNSPEAARFKDVKLIIWDEITMATLYALNAVDRLLRDIIGNERPFGGIAVLIGGDFRQCLPVVPRAHRVAIVEQCVKNSHLWPRFTKIHLDINMRTEPQQIQFAEWLLQLGDGTLKADHDGIPTDTIAIPDDCVTKNIIEAVYGPTIDVNDPAILNRAILCPKNEDCLQLNNTIINRIQNVENKTYYSADSIIADDEEERNNFPIEYLNTLSPSGMPPHKLTLKVGVIVMLLRNINVTSGLCNGTRLIVKKLMSNCIDAEIATGRFQGNRVLIPRIDLAPSDTNLPFILKRRQFPVRASFAMTINKAQGQTLDRVGIYLPSPVFSHGQLYVAFSRGKSKENVKVEVSNSNIQGQLLQNNNTVFTRNVVYREVLD